MKVPKLTSLYGLSIPSEVKITGRITTIRGAFIKAIIPEVPFTNEEVKQWSNKLMIDTTNPRCSYCGGKASELDHFFAAVKDKRPTGYVTDLYNLVPSCGKCNQSKGGRYWKTWITGNAKNSPTTLNVPDLERRIEILAAYEEWIKDKITIITVSDFEDNELFSKYFEECEELLTTFAIYQTKAEQLKKQMELHLLERKLQPAVAKPTHQAEH